jgi:2-oxoglutarate dehydrogenase E2 component (dihydrolipoamide succinyltransferase)
VAEPAKAELADVIVPPNAEGTRATVLRWCKQVGDPVLKDEPLVELETDKVTVEIPSPASGTLVEVLKAANAEVNPDEVLARLSLQSLETLESLGDEAAPLQPSPKAAAPPIARPRPRPDATPARKLLSPSVRRLIQQHSMEAADIEGTGRDGRITAQDVTRRAAEAAKAQIHEQAHAQVRAGSTTRVPHTAIRRRVAEHIARSIVEAPHVTTLFEADLTRVLAHRARFASNYESRGTRLTLTAYFISACVQALRAHPEINATYHADALELHADFNIGVGTALGDKGLIVPVIHRTQDLNLFGIAQRLGPLVEAARAGKLTPEDVRGGTFTISNHGVGGSLLAAPIVINQPQVAILGVGKVQRRVCALELDGVEAISVRSMCYVTLTIDHRALDAFQANAFLSLVVATLEQWPAEEP